MAKKLSDYLYYEEEGLTIYCGDCLEIMPLLPDVDLIITDPPYGIGADKNLRANKQHGKAAAPSKDYGIGDWDSRTPVQEIFDRILTHSQRVCIFGGNYFDLPQMPGWLVWDKDNGNNGYADCELVWTNYKSAVRRLRFQWMGMIQENMKEKEYRWHPTQKPIPVMRWAITKCDIEALTVLDPFLGSGTTLVACKELGRNGIGIEINPKYCEIAKKRLQNTQRMML